MGLFRPSHVDLSKSLFFQQMKFMNMELMTDAPGFCGPSTVSKNKPENWFVQTPLIWGISMNFKDQIGVRFKKRNDLSNRFSTVFLHNSLSAFATQTFHGLVRVIPTLLQPAVACGASTGLVHGWWSHRISSFVFYSQNCTFWIILSGHILSCVLNPCLTGNVSETWCYVMVYTVCIRLSKSINKPQIIIPIFYSKESNGVGKKILHWKLMVKTWFWVYRYCLSLGSGR